MAKISRAKLLQLQGKTSVHLETFVVGLVKADLNSCYNEEI